MQNSYPFNVINDLPELQFIAGSNQELTFYVYTSASAPVDLSGATIAWSMAYYGSTTAVISKVGYNSGGSNYFNVYLNYNDTASLGGKFIHQYTIADTSGSTFHPSQGIINIIPQIY